MVSKKIIIIAVAVVIIAIGAVGVYLWWSFSASFANVEGVTNNLVNRLNSYDAAGVWALASDGMKEYWTYAELEETMDDLQLVEWHATIKSIDSKEIETIMGWEYATLTLTLECTDTVDGTYPETWEVGLSKTDGEWKIDGWGLAD